VREAISVDGFLICHSERGEESILNRLAESLWILRCAQNDKLFFRHVMNFFTRFFARVCKKNLKKEIGRIGPGSKIKKF